mgnify:CR=1 FL=1
MQFTENSLELSIMELFENEGYSHNFKQIKPNKNAKQIVLYLI